jgi:hypothetical protein
MVCYTEVFTLPRLFHMYTNLTGPTETGCCREVSALQGVCCTVLYCSTVLYVRTYLPEYRPSALD